MANHVCQCYLLPCMVTSCIFIQHMHISWIFIIKIQKHFQNVMLVGMASEISKNYTYKCVDHSRHNEIKGAKAKCAHLSNLSAHI